MIAINEQRLLADLYALRKFGAKGSGVVRQSLSSADIESRQWLASRFSDAGLQSSIDGVGNVLGEMLDHKKSILIGSHTDTQPEGGWLDGALGVIYGLEIARAFLESDIRSEVGLDVASWMDEEGTFGHSLGSRSFCNKLGRDELKKAQNSDEQYFTAALEAAGYTKFPIRRLDKSRHIAYLEAHIEQGPFLESERKSIGIVSAIVGAREFQVEFKGEQNHAGTTPMHLRKDAGMAMFRFAAELNRRFTEIAAEGVVWTFGRVTLKPNAPSAIPESAALSVQFRCGVEKVLNTFESGLYELAKLFAAEQSGVSISLNEVLRFDPAPMNSVIQGIMSKAAKTRVTDKWITMPSGAGHDAQFFWDEIPTAMLFIPSTNGISHSFLEDTPDEDIILGCEVLADAILSMIPEPSVFQSVSEKCVNTTLSLRVPE